MSVRVNSVVLNLGPVVDPDHPVSIYESNWADMKLTLTPDYGVKAVHSSDYALYIEKQLADIAKLARKTLTELYGEQN